MKTVTDVSLVGIFGALTVISSAVPVSIVQGGGVFTLAWVMQTLAGILLGPYTGGLATLLGGFIGNMLLPSRIGPIAIILPSVAAVQAGLIVWGYWFLAAPLLGAVTLVWFLLPVGILAWPVALFHISGLIIIITLGRRLSKSIMDGRRTKCALIGWALTAYCANITRHMLGNIVYVLMLSLQAEIFLGAIPSTAIEQTMFAAVSAMIGIPLLMAVRNAQLDIPLVRLGRREPDQPG